jgi:large subunit ribosomal protein L24
MKFKVGDQVIVTAGKDKGYKGQIVKVLPAKEEVVVGGANLYTRHVKKAQGRAGEKMRLERPLSTAKIAILNDKGEVDRIGYQGEGTSKVRIFKKTGAVIADAGKTAKAAAKKADKAEKK